MESKRYDLGLSEEDIKLLTPEGFADAFYKELSNPRVCSQQQAYDRVEKRFESIFKRRRYSQFENFRKYLYRKRIARK